MALLNEIQVGRINRLAQKLLSMKGPAAIPQLASELRFSVPIFHGVENRYLEGWDSFGVSVVIAAQGVGNQGAFRLRNPKGSNLVAVVTYASVFPQVAAAANPSFNFVRSGATDLTPVALPAGGTNFDGRGRPNPSAIPSTGTATFPGANPFNTQQPSGGPPSNLVPTEFPLLPDSMMEIAEGTANVAVLATVWWRERFLEDSERT